MSNLLGLGFRRDLGAGARAVLSDDCLLALQWGMPVLTRRRSQNRDQESWLICHGDVHVGTIGIRSGVPVHVDQWQWSRGFYPVGERENGTAADFDQARADFEVAWRQLLPRVTEADFAEHRREHA